jgi:KDO2-lipid IV(A) lauroyltransferase
MLTGLLRLFSKLPLAWLHASGVVLGWLSYRLSPSYADRLRENLRQSGICNDQADFDKLLKRNIREAGKAITELPAVWFRPQQQSAAWIKKVEGWELVENAQRQANGLILLTPHLGCFEVLPQYYALRYPVTVLYRPPRFGALEPAMRAGRLRPNIGLATTDVKGVRQLLKALHRGESIGMLPDQVPGAGDGEWADFFGRPAYTMTLWSRLAQRSKAPVVLLYALRLASGTGFEARLESMPPREPGESAARHLNRALENIIRRCPEQYLWAYNRYKAPPGVPAPPSARAADGRPAEMTG